MVFDGAHVDGPWQPSSEGNQIFTNVRALALTGLWGSMLFDASDRVVETRRDDWFARPTSANSFKGVRAEIRRLVVSLVIHRRRHLVIRGFIGRVSGGDFFFSSAVRRALRLRLRFLPTRLLPSVAGISPSRAARVIVANVDPSPHPPTVTAASAPHATTHAAPIIFVTRPRPWVLGTLARSPLARSADSSSVIAAGVGIVDARPSSSTLVGINRRRARAAAGGARCRSNDRSVRLCLTQDSRRSRSCELPHTIMCSVSSSEIT